MCIRDRYELGSIAELVGDDVVAEIDALVADVHARSRDELLDLLLTLRAETALYKVAAFTEFCHGLPPTDLPPWSILRASAAKSRYLSARRYNFVNQAVFHGLVGTDDEVAVGVFVDALHRLTGVGGEHCVQHVLHPQDFARLNLNVRSLSPDATPRLVQQHARVGQRVALSLRSRAQQHRRRGSGLAETERRHVGLDVLHGVVDRQQ